MQVKLLLLYYIIYKTTIKYKKKQQKTMMTQNFLFINIYKFNKNMLGDEL